MKVSYSEKYRYSYLYLTDEEVEVKSVSEGHVARLWQSQDSNPCLLILIPVSFLANHVASEDCSSLFTGSLLLPTHTSTPTSSSLKHCVCIFIRIIFIVFSIHVLVWVWGEKKIFHQLALGPTWKKRKLKCCC